MPRVAKDADKPKGRMSAYAYFMQTCREDQKKTNPGGTVNFSEFTKKCAERWKVSLIDELAIHRSMQLTQKRTVKSLIFTDNDRQGEAEIPRHGWQRQSPI
jgi:hypothetical protein